MNRHGSPIQRDGLGNVAKHVDAAAPQQPAHDTFLSHSTPRCDGLEATRRITADQRLAQVKIIILTTFDLDEYIFEAPRAGASGFLVKDTEPVDLIRGIQAVARGDALLSPGVTRRLIAAFATLASKTQPVPGLATLTEREREVMALVAGGLSNDEIAERLVISPTTAKTHVSRAAAPPRGSPHCTRSMHLCSWA